MPFNYAAVIRPVIAPSPCDCGPTDIRSRLSVLATLLDMIMSRDQNAGRSYSMKIDNNSLEGFNYLGKTLTSQYSIQVEIKSRFKSGNACYNSVQNLLSSSLLSKNLKINIYRTIILLVLLHGCKTLSLKLREEHKLRVFENRVLRRIFGPKKDEVTVSGDNYTMRSSVICTPHQILFK